MSYINLLRQSLTSQTRKQLLVMTGIDGGLLSRVLNRRREVTPAVAVKLDDATAALHKATNGAVPHVTAPQLCSVCASCKYAKR